jgi:excisionase family DNA binding protein
MSDTEFLTTKQVSEILNCHQITVAKLIKRGRFPGARKFDPSGRTSPYRIPREAVDAFLKSQIVIPESQADE